MNDSQRLLLALGITEWANTAAHFDAMIRQGLVVPADAVVMVSRELGFLMRRWSPSLESPDLVIAQARRYCTEHVTELDSIRVAR